MANKKQKGTTNFKVKKTVDKVKGVGENKVKKEIVEWVKALIIAGLIALVVRTWIIEPYRIPSGSMENTLLIGDFLFVNKSYFRFHKPKRFDIVVFKFPKDRRTNFVKRVIGLPGEILEIKNGHTYINGKEIAEPFIKEPMKMAYFPPTYIPKNNYFVMGDNRNNSYDSRYWGFVPKDLIRGRPMFIYFSWRVGSPYFIFDLKHKIRWHRIFKVLR